MVAVKQKKRGKVNRPRAKFVVIGTEGKTKPKRSILASCLSKIAGINLNFLPQTKLIQKAL